jgi:hypothetical protein
MKDSSFAIEIFLSGLSMSHKSKQLMIHLTCHDKIITLTLQKLFRKESFLRKEEEESTINTFTITITVKTELTTASQKRLPDDHHFVVPFESFIT